MKVYKGLMIHQCSRNEMGMRWGCHSPFGYLRADTLAGLKRLITRKMDEARIARFDYEVKMAVHYGRERCPKVADMYQKARGSMKAEMFKILYEYKYTI